MIGRVHGDAPDWTASDRSDVDNVADALHSSMTRELCRASLRESRNTGSGGVQVTTYFGPQSRPPEWPVLRGPPCGRD